MNKNIEQDLKGFKLAKPPSGLKAKVLSNAMSDWHERKSRFAFYRQLRYMLPAAACFALFLGTIITLNWMKAGHMRQALSITNEKSLQKTEETIKFLEEIGLEREYGAAIARFYR